MALKFTFLLVSMLVCVTHILTSPTPAGGATDSTYKDTRSFEPIKGQSKVIGRLLDYAQSEGRLEGGTSTEHPISQTLSIGSLGLTKEEVIPDRLIGPALTDHFRNVVNNEKPWLRHVVQTRLKLLKEIKLLLGLGVKQKTLYNVFNDNDYTGSYHLLHNFKSLLQEMREQYKWVNALYPIADRYRWKIFNESDHGEGIGKVNKWVDRAIQFEEDIGKMKLWTDMIPLTQDLERVDPVNAAVPQVKSLDEAIEQAEDIALRLD